LSLNHDLIERVKKKERKSVSYVNIIVIKKECGINAHIVWIHVLGENEISRSNKQTSYGWENIKVFCSVDYQRCKVCMYEIVREKTCIL